MKRNELIRFIRKNNRFYAKADMSFYTEEQLKAIRDKIIKAQMAKPAS